MRADLSALGQPFTGLVLQSPKAAVETIEQTGWAELARYPDKTPALLSRQLGKGRIVYLNAAYQSQWYIQHRRARAGPGPPPAPDRSCEGSLTGPVDYRDGRRDH